MARPKLTLLQRQNARTDFNIKLESRGIKMIGDYINSNTKTEFECSHGHNWLAAPHHVTEETNCPYCAGTRLTMESISTKLEPKGITMLDEYVNTRTKNKFQCSNGHYWQTKLSIVMGGSGCPHCVGLLPLSKEIVNDRIKSKGIQMIGEFVNTNTESLFECLENHRWFSKPSLLMYSKYAGCPTCNPPKSGYSTSKPGTFYILNFGTFIKYGISNNFKLRSYRHKNNGEFSVVFTKFFEDGVALRELETKVKQTLGGRFVTKEQMPDGFTETLCITKLDQILLLVE